MTRLERFFDSSYTVDVDKLALLKRRLSAASSQILDFGCGAEKFEQANTLQAKCEVKIEGEKKVITYRFISVPPDEDLHILASSCVHHLRSVCDNIVVALGEKYSLNNWEQLAFPNFLKSSDFDKWKAKNSGFSSDLLDAFASLQPTEVVDSPFGSLSNSIHPMQLLSILNNHDKHRMLIVLRRDEDSV